MNEQEFEDLENHIASHLKPVREGEKHWSKAMSLIDHTIDEAVKAERQRCIDDVLSAWSASSLPEEHEAWKRCQETIHQKIRSRDEQKVKATT